MPDSLPVASGAVHCVQPLYHTCAGSKDSARRTPSCSALYASAASCLLPQTPMLLLLTVSCYGCRYLDLQALQTSGPYFILFTADMSLC